MGLAARFARWQRTRAASATARAAAAALTTRAVGLAVEVEESAHLRGAARPLGARTSTELRERAERTHPADLAAALRELTLDDRVAVFRQLPRRRRARS